LKLQSHHTILAGLLFLVFSLLSCQQRGGTPKPRGYFSVHFPEKKYQLFDEPGYPYTFEYPVYANVVKDSLFFDEETENPWWINVDIPEFMSKIYISYKEVAKNDMNNLINDAFKLTYKHTTRAASISEIPFQTIHGSSGMFYEVSGNAASAKQFFLTDSAHHFIRGALYFYAPPNADSLAPMIQFLEADMKHMVQSLKWRSN
jgi:gliding motility-associated lipoprotein GldD